MMSEKWLSIEDQSLLKILELSPTANISDEKKMKTMLNLFKEYRKGNREALDKLFDYIAQVTNQSNFLNVVWNFEMRMKSGTDQYEEFQKAEFLRCYSKDTLVQSLADDVIPFNKYAIPIIQKIFNQLNENDIEALLSTYRKSPNQLELKQYIVDNYKGGYCANTYFKLMPEIDILDKLPYEEKINAAERECFLYEQIKGLKEEDRLYLECVSHSLDLTPVTKDTVIKFFDKYKDLPVLESRGLNIVDYLTVDEMKEILPLYDKDCLRYKLLEKAIIHKEFLSLSDAQKKKKLLESDFTTFEKYLLFTTSSLKLLNDEELLGKINNQVIRDVFLATTVSKRFKFEELKKNNVKMTYLINIENLPLLEENLNDTEKHHLINKLAIYSRDNNEYKALFMKMLEETTDAAVPMMEDYLTTEELVAVLKKNKSLCKNIYSFSKYSKEELLALKEYAYDNENYLASVFTKRNHNGDSSDDFSKLQLDMLEFVKKDYYIYNKEFFEDMDLLKGTIEIKNENSMIKALKNLSQVHHSSLIEYIDDNHLEEQILSVIDSSGDLMKLYRTITDNEKKLEEKKIKVEDAKMNFWKNIDNIKANKEILLKLQESNKFVMSTINYRFLNILSGEKLEYFARYKYLDRGITDLDKEETVELVSKITGRLLEISDYSDPLFEKCLMEISRMGILNISGLLDKDIDTVIYLMNKRPHLLFTDINNLAKNEKVVFDSIMETSTDLKVCLDTFFKEKCKMDLETAERLVRVYSNDLETLKAMYAEDKKLSNSIHMLETMKKILETNNVESIKELYKTNKAVDSFLFPYVLEENLKKAYNRELNQKLYKVKEEDLVEDNIYEVKGDFNMMVTVIGAYVKNNTAIDNPKKDWNDDEKVINHGICSSFIGNNNLSMAYDPDKLIYGFDTLEETAIVKSANYDIYSISDKVEINAYKEDKFMLSKTLIDNVRLGHSEQVVERRIGQTNVRRQPSYVIAIDTVKEKDRVAAQDFGIPIVLIKSENIAIQESKKLFEAFKDVRKLPTTEKIRNLVIEYHNNYAGLKSVNPAAGQKYFNPKMVEGYFMALVKQIHAMEDGSNKEELLTAFMEALREEEEKRIKVRESYIPFKFDRLKDEIVNGNSKEKENSISFWDKVKRAFKR